jgi:hypothetical protein
MMKSDFKSALTEYRAHVKAGTERTPAGMRAFRRFLDAAPPEFVAEFHAESVKMGVIPKPSRYVNGEPVYSFEAVADHFEIPVEEVRQLATEWEAESSGVIIRVDSAGVARIH